jgi:hypothetical protein
MGRGWQKTGKLKCWNSGVLECCNAGILEWSGLVHERSIAVQAICIPLNFLMLSVGILMASFPTGCVKTQNTTDKRTVCNTQSVK